MLFSIIQSQEQFDKSANDDIHNSSRSTVIFEQQVELKQRAVECLSFNLRARVISQILELFGFATSRTTTDKQEDLLKKLKTLRATKTPSTTQSSFDRRGKEPTDEQEREMLNEHEINKILFPDDFLAKAVHQKLETINSTGAKQTVVADAGTVERRLIFVEKWEIFSKNFASELQVIQRIKAQD